MNPDEIVDRLRARRAELGLSQRRLAEIAGYNHSTLDGWETLRRTPRLQQLCDWCQALGVWLEIRS